ncbi:MAG: hypothetical protein VKN72_26030 [Nostocales cyanobacterium 94392]|nr:hypothetical protein [Nostocales cyanobacterium 94392]
MSIGDNIKINYESKQWVRLPVNNAGIAIALLRSAEGGSDRITMQLLNLLKLADRAKNAIFSIHTPAAILVV